MPQSLRKNRDSEGNVINVIVEDYLFSNRIFEKSF